MKDLKKGWTGLSTLTYFSTCPFGQLTKKSTGPKKIIKLQKLENNYPGLPLLSN